MSVHESKDFISDMVCNDDSTTLLATRWDDVGGPFNKGVTVANLRKYPRENACVLSM